MAAENRGQVPLGFVVERRTGKTPWFLCCQGGAIFWDPSAYMAYVWESEERIAAARTWDSDHFRGGLTLHHPVVGHVLKTVEPHFSEVAEERKTFDLRYEDNRRFEPGDVIALVREPASGSPVRVCRRVTHLLRGPVYGLVAGSVIMSLATPWFPGAKS